MKQYRKIDIYILSKEGEWRYYLSTTRSRTCREAKLIFRATHSIHSDKIKTSFAPVKYG